MMSWVFWSGSFQDTRMVVGDSASACTRVGTPGRPSAHRTVRRALACVEPALFSAMHW